MDRLMATCPGRRVRYPALGETHFKTNINTVDIDYMGYRESYEIHYENDGN